MICAVAIMINLTTFAWNEHDAKIMKQQLVECPKRYKNSPCLSKFIKTGERDYRVLCAHPVDENKEEDR